MFKPLLRVPLAPLARASARRAYSSEPELRISFEPTSESGCVAIASLNRPKAKNALSRQLVDDLYKFITSLATGDPEIASGKSVDAFILASTSSDIFCAGADLKERRTFTPHDTSAFLHKLNTILTLIEKLEIPTISAVDGIALGGGLEIALSTDFRVFGASAKVGLPETHLAIVPGAGGTHRLPRLIGYSRALDLVLTGRRVSPSEALQLGLANRIVSDPSGSVVDEALTLAKSICNGGPLAFRAAKKAVRGASPDWEKLAYSTVINSEDKFEALDAFAAKRKPVFKGK